MRFEMVLRTRPDIMFLTSVQPHCSYHPRFAYMSHPEPADWVMILPRHVAANVLFVPFHYFYECRRARALNFTNFSLPKPLMAVCCGGGPTALMVGGVISSRAPLIGPPWPAPNVPAGSTEVRRLFQGYVVRFPTKENEWCTHTFLMQSPENDQMQGFPDQATCFEMLG